MVNSINSSRRESDDMALFNEIAAEYCRKDLHATAQIARKQRLLRTLATVDLPSDYTILEAGCGAGFSAAYLRGRYLKYHGIDYSETLIDYANKHNAASNVTFSAENIKTFEANELYDVIVMIGVLHHLDEIGVAMENLFAALKPGGYLLANEPQSGNPLVRVARVVRARVDAAYSEDQIELGRSRMRSIFEAAGLTNIRIVPQGIFSTPFAEVPLGPKVITRPLAKLACLADTSIESVARPVLFPITWNLIGAGQRQR